MNTRSYSQFCALAYALDVVGDRWTLLIIRELLTGPRRFMDLVAGLPGISSNLLSDRLKRLEQQGLLCRRVLPPPAGSTVYELSPLGQALESALIELGRWGSQFLPPSLEGVALPSLGAIALAIQAFFHPQAAQGVDEIYELHLDDQVLQVHVKDGAMRVQQGQSRQADVRLYTNMQVFVGLFAGQLDPHDALSAGLIRVEGDSIADDSIADDGIAHDGIAHDPAGALIRFLNLTGVPGYSPGR